MRNRDGILKFFRCPRKKIYTKQQLFLKQKKSTNFITIFYNGVLKLYSNFETIGYFLQKLIVPIIVSKRHENKRKDKHNIFRF